MKQIKILVDESGEVEITTTGFKGQACEKATAELEKALGVVSKRKRTPEFFQSIAAQQKVGS